MSRDGLVLPLLEAAAGTSSTSNSSAAGVPTLTTPTLTPTTLRNIEQMFMDSQAAECRPPDPHENAARFEPPAVSIHDQYNNGDTNDVESKTAEVKQEWVADGSVLPGPESNEKHLLQNLQPQIQVTPPPPTIIVASAAPPPPPPPQNIELPKVPLGLLPTEPIPISGAHQVNNPPTAAAAAQINGTTPPIVIQQQPAVRAKKSSPPSSSSGGGRKPNPSTNLTPDEESKKILRRQRNKEAAARCRKRRLDQTMTLQDEVDQLEGRKSAFKDEIKALESQKQELESMLTSHRSVCKAKLLQEEQRHNKVIQRQQQPQDNEGAS